MKALIIGERKRMSATAKLQEPKVYQSRQYQMKPSIVLTKRSLRIEIIEVGSLP
jgi:hypothetical protein